MDGLRRRRDGEKERVRVRVRRRRRGVEDTTWGKVGGEAERERERRREVSVRRIKNAGAKGSRGFHLTE